MNAVPLNTNILVKRIKEDELSSGGIIIPDNAKEKPYEGFVVSIGSKVSELEIGDKVIFGKYVGLDTLIENEEFTILKEDEVLVKFSKGD